MNPKRSVKAKLRTFLSLNAALIAALIGGGTAAAAGVAGVVTGAISVPGERDAYTFTVDTPSRFYFDSLTNNSQLNWILTGPSGFSVNRAFDGSDAQSVGDPSLGLAPGSYTFTIQESNGGSDGYAFRFLNFKDAALVTPGTTISANLAPANATVLYQFVAAAGDQFVFHEISKTGLPNSHWRLFDPYGQQVFNQGFSDVGTVATPVRLSAGGTYVLAIEGYIGDTGSGSFSFVLQPQGNVPPVAFTGTPLTLGAPVSGNFTANSTVSYTFSLPTATMVSFDSFVNSSGLVWTLEGPSGIVVNQRGVNSSDGTSLFGPLQLPAGNYQVRLTGGTTVNYQFQLIDLSAVATLTPGTPVTATLNPASSTAAFKFDASKGDRFYFDSITLTGAPNAYWRLIDPNGVAVFNTYAYYDAGSYTLGVTGTYTVLIEGYLFETGNGSFTFNVTPAVDILHALTLGTTANDSVASPGQRHQYSFNLPTAATLYFDSQTSSSRLHWSLDGPDGNVVNARNFNGSDAQSFGSPLIHLNAGSYVVTVFADADQTGPFTFRLFDLATATALTPGVAASNSLNPANATIAYKFSIAAAGSYYFDYQGSSGLANTWVRLYDGHDTLYLNQGLGSDNGPFNLPAGDYLLLVEGYVGDAGSGNYTFNLVQETNGSQALTVGSVVNASITQPGQVQKYTFTVGATGQFYFDSLTNKNAAYWSLDGPEGNFVNQRNFVSSDAQSQSNPVLTLTPGAYTLTIMESGDNVGTLPFRLLDLSGASPLTVGADVSGALDPANSSQFYKFTLASAGKYFYDYKTSSGLPNGWVRLLDSHGRFLINGGLGSDAGPLSLEAGTYYLLVEGYIGENGTGSYTFNFTPLTDGAQTLTVGSVVSGSITTPGQQQVYNFTLSSTKKLCFDSLVNSGSLRWNLTGPLGTVINNLGFNNADAQSGNSIIDLGQGSYVLTVFGTGDAVGDYQFALLDLSAAATLTLGTAVNPALNPANATKTYQFNVATTGKYFYDFQTATGLGNTYLRLIGPTGVLVKTSALSDFGPVTLVPGTYYLVIEGYIGDPGSGNLTFAMNPVVDGTQALTLGALTTGTLTGPGQIQQYTFTLTSEKQLYFDSRTASGTLHWFLDGPVGNVVNGRPFSSSDAQNIGNPMLDLAPGDYTLSVATGSDALGSYQFRLFDLATASPLTIGANAGNNTFTANATDAYRFNAALGDKFNFVKVSATGAPNLYWRLIDPLGGIVFSQSFSSDPGIKTLLLPGTYTLLVEGYVYDTVDGSYSFNVSSAGNQSQTPFTGTALTLGTTQSGNLATGSTVDSYIFTLTTPSQLYFDSLTSASFNWTLQSHAGVIVNSRSFQGCDGVDFSDPRLILPAGDYQLNITGLAGAYKFRMLDLAVATPISPGTAVTTTLTPANATTVYKFDGVAGTQLYFDGQGYTDGPGGGGAYAAYVRVFGPLGNMIVARNVDSDQDVFTLAQTGTYTVTLEGRIYDGHDNQTNAFMLVPVTSPTNTLTLGTTVSDTASTLGMRHYYTFTLASAKTLYFDALTRADFYWRLDAPSGQVIDWRSFSGSDGQEISDPALRLPAGSYTLTVAGNNFAVTGNYSFRLLDFSTGPALTPGAITTTTLTGANSTAIYHFSATAGDRFYFDGQGYTDSGSGGSTYPAYVRMYGPSKTIVLAQSVNNQTDTFAVPETGDYTVTVEGRIYDDRPNQTNSFRLIPIIYPTQALTLGNTINATIATPGIRQAYTFTTATPVTLFVDALSNSDFYWRLDATWGQVMDWRSFLGSDSVDVSNPTLRLEPGSYTFTVAGSGFHVTGDYSIRLIDSSTATPFTPGSPVASTLNPADSTVLYTFAGTAGAAYYFDGLGYTNAPGSGSSYPAYVRIFSPTGKIILAQSVDRDVDTFSLPENGNYIVSVEGRVYDPHTSQANGFNLVPVVNSTAPLTLGATINGSLATPGIRNAYTFTLNEPHFLYFDSLANADFYWRLDAPWGQVVNWRSFQGSDAADVNDPSMWLPSGSYTLTVAGNNFVVTGDYAFRLLDFAAASPMSPGTVTSGTLSPARATVLYKFNANAGDLFFFDGQSSSGFNYQPYVRLYSPYGLRLFSQNVNGNVDTFRVNESGTYIVTVEGRIFDNATSGDFAFNLVPVPPTQSVPLFDTGSVPDLISENITVTPESGIQSGGQVTVHWTDRNTGNAAAVDSFSDRITIRNSAHGVLADTIAIYSVDAVGNGPIAPTETRQRQAVLTLPDGPTATGTLEVTVIADALNNIFESNETNNAATGTFTATLAPYPDLVVENVSTTPAQNWTPGSTVTANWRVHNTGNGTVTSDFSDNVVVRNTSSSTVIASGNTNYTVAATGNGPIGPNDIRDRSVNFTVPPGNNAYGLFSIVVTTDGGQTVFEYNSGGSAEQNNSGSAQTLSAPDLSPTAVTVSAPGPITSGSTVTLQWTDQNIGTAALSSGFYDQVLVTKTGTGEVLFNNVFYFDPNNPVLGTLPPGDVRTRSTTFTLPDGPAGAGSFQVKVTSDVYNNVSEVNLGGTAEANNIATSSIASSTLSPYPDLQVVGLTVQPGTLGANTNVLVTWKDTNSGNGIAVPSWYDRILIVNTNSGVTLIDTVLYHNSSLLGPLTNGTAHDRSFSFTLPNDTDATGTLRFLVVADYYNNVFEYNGGGTGEVNNSAELFRPLTATPLPDLVITSITAPATATANQSVNAQFRIENKGTADSTNTTTQRVYISSSPSPGSGTLVVQKDYSSNITTGAGADQSFSFLAPSTPGTYWLIVQADAANNVVESRESNNYFVSATPLTVQPTYTATVTAGIHSALAGTAIPLSGVTTLTGTSTPAPLQAVTIHIQVRGTDRTFQVFSGPDGTFSTIFHPLPTEAGDYTVSAGHPALPAPAPQDSFTLIGMNANPIGVINVVEGQTSTNMTPLVNLSDVPLTGLTVQVGAHQPNLDVTATLDANQLSSFATANLKITVHAIDSSFIQSPLTIHITSAEGATADLVVTVRVEPLLPRLVVTASALSGVMQRGSQSPRAFTIANQGGIATSPLQVVLPNVPWLSLASASQLDPLTPGASNVVTILLNPPADLPLGDYNGTIVLQGSNAGIQVPYSFRAVSTAKGDLSISAEDEYTYFAAGSPKVANASVTIRDALSGTVIATGQTGADGTAAFPGLTEAFYLIDVSADTHNSFRQSAFVPGGGQTNVVAFLSRQSVQYSFTVTPATVQDHYVFDVQSTFETQVPVPVVTIEPASLDLAQYPQDEFQVQFTISNHGLIDAAHVSLNIPSTDKLQFTQLVTNLGKLPANTSLTVPVMVKRLNTGQFAGKPGKAAAGGGSCSVTGQMLWDYLCGPNVVDKNSAVYVFDSTGCDLVALYRQVYNLVPDGGSGGGGPPSPVLTSDEFFDYLETLNPVTDFEAPPGYHFECKAAPGPLTSGKKVTARAGTNVCAKVEIRLSQRAVLARDAFNATLSIDNDVPSSMNNIQVTLQINDLNGTPVIDQFGVTLGQLTGISAVDGNGTIGAQSQGVANWTIVPTLDAAPSSGVTTYLVSGTLSYTQDGTVVTVPLAAAPIQVYPQPELLVKYFHDRNVYADDPFTPQIEPSVPYSLAAMVQNVGHGAARSLSISGAKPEIRENIKGLLVDFKIEGTQLENDAVNPSLDINFGRIEPGTNKIARWLFTSTIQGSFTNFSASFSQVDQFGNPRTSLIRGVEIHELNHIVDANGPGADGRPDFLANDVSDIDFTPDTLYLSDGTTAPVTAVTDGTVSGTLASDNLTVTLNVTAGSGYRYIRFGDPGQGQFRLTQVKRSDGTVVPFGQNVWTTDRNFRGSDLVPILTNLVHIFDYNNGASYTLSYQPVSAAVADTTAPTSSVQSLPASSPANFTVQWSGSDNADGSGIALYDIYSSTNGGAFGIWLASTPLTASTFTGAPNTTYAFYSRAVDAAGNREAAHSVADASTVTTAGQNLPPVITAIPDQTVAEGSIFTILPVASNDSPLESLAWSLQPGFPAGALLSPSNGRVTWQTSLGQGGTTNRFTLVVTDSGTPSMSATQSFNVIVIKKNYAPVIGAVTQPVVLEQGSSLSLQLTATDANVGDTLVWQLQPGAPTGVALSSAGLLTWTPTAAQNNLAAVIQVQVTDNGAPPLSASTSIALKVHSPNHAPSLASVSNVAGSVLNSVVVNASATDPDGSSQLLTYSLDAGAPQGAKINPVTGAFRWTPNRAQANSVNTVTIRVTDNGDPAMTDTKTFTITVDDFVEVLLGSANFFAGQPGGIPIGLDLSSPITNLDFTVTIPSGFLQNLTLPAPVAPLGTATLTPTTPGSYRVQLRAGPSQTLLPAQALSTLQFEVRPDSASGVVDFHLSDVQANRADGLQVTRVLVQDGQSVIVQDAPVLGVEEISGQASVTIFARPSITYIIESTPTLNGPITWSENWRGTVDNFQQTVTFPIGTTGNMFYRARTP